jgi:hypothetical protein
VTESVIDQPLAIELGKHRGEWVALENNQVIASASTAVEVWREAQQKGVTDPVVFRVPLHPEHVAYL